MTAMYPFCSLMMATTLFRWSVSSEASGSS
jgi:hypothetical protein